MTRIQLQLSKFTAKAYFKCQAWLLVMAALVLLSGCSQPDLSPLDSDSKILAFGDSLTEGYGVKKGRDYPSVLSQLTGLQVINAGISGETTAQGLERIEEVLQNYQPDLVILMEGGNDVLRKVPLHKTKANLEKMIELIQQTGAEVVLIGMPEKKLFADALPLYEELAEQFQVPMEEDIIASLLMRPSMKSDYVHFNEQGYRELAEAVYQLLYDRGALKNLVHIFPSKRL